MTDRPTGSTRHSRAAHQHTMCVFPLPTRLTFPGPANCLPAPGPATGSPSCNSLAPLPQHPAAYNWAQRSVVDLTAPRTSPGKPLQLPVLQQPGLPGLANTSTSACPRAACAADRKPAAPPLLCRAEQRRGHSAVALTSMLSMRTSSRGLSVLGLVLTCRQGSAGLGRQWGAFQ